MAGFLLLVTVLVGFTIFFDRLSFAMGFRRSDVFDLFFKGSFFFSVFLFCDSEGDGDVIVAFYFFVCRGDFLYIVVFTCIVFVTSTTI